MPSPSRVGSLIDDAQASTENHPGAVVRAIRTNKGWTLADLSKRIGIPVSTLSKVETGKMSLNYEKLLSISTGLDVDIARLFSTNSPVLPAPAAAAIGRRSITPSGEGQSITTATYNYVYPAADLLNKALNPMFIDIKIRSIEEFGDLMRHPGEEYAVVLEGQCEFHSDLYAPTLLNKGDSIYFDGAMGHGYVAVGEGPCRILSICSAIDVDMNTILKPIGDSD